MLIVLLNLCMLVISSVNFSSERISSVNYSSERISSVKIRALHFVPLSYRRNSHNCSSNRSSWLMTNLNKLRTISSFDRVNSYSQHGQRCLKGTRD